MIQKRKGMLPKSVIPLSLIASGILLSDSGLEKSLNTTTRNWVGNDFDVPVDDYTRYIPIALMYTADIVGVDAKSHWFDQTKNLAISMVLTDVLTKFLKNSIYKVRPNGFNDKSFPSGHTSISFSTGSVLYEEFKDTSPILAYSGYGLAATTGAFRLLNNKHWVSDVMVGAGLGVLVTKLVYHFDYLFKWNPFVKSKDITFIPRYDDNTVGFYFSKKL
ncbi:phosphatase PAP2 family protein [Zobellia barbeyronii]|uniref:Phosphatase PAP2 family protein n=1 Tax=Zobellia barbeyronii TaxID=2748009 RepID=A0ABS5WD38_9FLAO|nr:phosphatase PAP2 family protein [Zobellia barbeyronii]MBT2161277.1 phosphatase PAP2 family protein [Zobellia barbeyronii]